MNRHPFLPVVLTVFFVFIFCFSVNAAEDAPARPDLIIKISRLQQAINVIDKMAAADMDQPTSAPSFILRSLLFGTDWIDPNRAIVIGINFKNIQTDAKPVMAALVPYTRQNEDFHIAYNAVSKIDHYIVSLPPGEGGIVSDQMAYDLAQASLKKPDGLLSLELAASQLLNKADGQIRKMLLELDADPGMQQAAPEDLTPEEVSQLFKNLLDAAKQLEVFSMGVDISESELIIFSDALALKGSELSKLFTRNTESSFTRMGKYFPRHQINFKSSSYDIKGMLAFLNTIFGEFYKKIGLDLAVIESMAAHFTGEVAGGVSFTDSGMNIEAIAVLNETENGAEFLESVYLPWMMEHGQKMAAFYNRQIPGAQIKNIFIKAPESKLFDNKVFGVNCEIPSTIPGAPADEKFQFKFRTTAVGNLLLTASNDERLKQLIKIAGTLEKGPHDGPLMRMDMDLDAYFDAVRKMIPDSEPGMNLNLSNLGSLVYTFDIEKRRLSNKYVIQIDDIRSVVSAFRQAAASSPADDDPGIYPAERSFSQSAPTMLHHSGKDRSLKPKRENTAEFWLDKGLLYATYGNDEEAIKFYKKALQIEPDNTRTLFNIGISYTTLGDYDMAIKALNQAIALAPDNGDYHYGLGWVYLLKGESGKAMEYIRTADALGNPDARKYLLKSTAAEK